MLEELHLNKDLPYIMHVDLNSCFAIIEQQANRLLRGRPVGVAVYDTPRGFVLAASYEAKAKGIKLGVNVQQARSLCPGIIIMTPDPPKYREAHKLFKEVLLEYSPDVTSKSIDEFVLDFQRSPELKNRQEELRSARHLIEKTVVQSRILSAEPEISHSERLIHNQAMLKMGEDIKAKIRERLGEWVTVNIGISTNRFLAKYAAGFDKPDGMTLIDHTNLTEKYANRLLMDLPGINVRYRARLRCVGIYTPIDFLRADMHKLKKQVFKSINGYHWYRRLRGYEADAVTFSRKSIGHQYALGKRTDDMLELERLLMKLCEKTGRRLRKHHFYASGIHLYLGFETDQRYLEDPASFEHIYKMKSWHHGEKVHYRLYSTHDIYLAAKRLLHTAELLGRVRLMSVHVFGLSPWEPEQMSLFGLERQQEQSRKLGVTSVDGSVRSADAGKRVSDAVDALNNRYGEFVVTPAVMLDMQGTILDRVAFGQVDTL